MNQKPAPAAEVRREADGDEVFEYAVGDERIGSDDAGRRAAGEVEVQLAEAREVSGDARAPFALRYATRLKGAQGGIDVIGQQFTLLKVGLGRWGGGRVGAEGESNREFGARGNLRARSKGRQPPLPNGLVFPKPLDYQPMEIP